MILIVKIKMANNYWDHKTTMDSLRDAEASKRVAWRTPCATTRASSLQRIEASSVMALLTNFDKKKYIEKVGYSQRNPSLSA